MNKVNECKSPICSYEEILMGSISGAHIKASSIRRCDSDSWIVDVPDHVRTEIRELILARGITPEETDEALKHLFAVIGKEHIGMLIDSIPDIKTGVATSGFALSDTRYDRISKQECCVDPRPETVKCNSRQKIMDNGKHKWPGAKARKGHRK